MGLFFSLSSNENLFSGTVPFCFCSWSSQLLRVNNQGSKISTCLSMPVEEPTENSRGWESSLLWRLPDEDLIKLGVKRRSGNFHLD